tara:strand:+ start:2948 stop:3118 length:171 start_codon:yes stop_codon:yes gene_type:complete
MKKIKYGFAAFGLVIGVFIGSSTGVAALGSAINGAYIFGPLACALGFMLGIIIDRR